MLMSLLQLIAADLAGVDRLVFHSPGGGDHFDEARRILEGLRREKRDESQLTLSTRDLLSRIEKLNFEWGVGDGN